MDTCSLLSLVRYYLPFDKNKVLYHFFKDKVSCGEIIIIDKVLDECKNTSSGLVLKELTFLDDKSFLKSNKLPIKTKEIFPPSSKRFLNDVDNRFVIGAKKNRLTESEYQTQKNIFLESADIRMIILCLNLIQELKLEEVFIATEETRESNDNKLFKKIPAICELLEIPVITLPKLIEMYEEIDLNFSNKYFTK